MSYIRSFLFWSGILISVSIASCDLTQRGMSVSRPLLFIFRKFQLVIVNQFEGICEQTGSQTVEVSYPSAPKTPQLSATATPWPGVSSRHHTIMAFSCWCFTLFYTNFVNKLCPQPVRGKWLLTDIQVSEDGVERSPQPFVCLPFALLEWERGLHVKSQKGEKIAVNLPALQS